MPKKMPKALQISMLQDIFSKLNPGGDPQLIDWESQVDETLTFPENRLRMAQIYPTYEWFKTEEELKGQQQEALEELRDHLDFTLGFVDPEIAEDIKDLFEKRMGAYRYLLGKGISIAKLKKEISTLSEEVEEAKRRAREKSKKLKEQLEATTRIVDVAEEAENYLERIRDLSLMDSKMEYAKSKGASIDFRKIYEEWDLVPVKDQRDIKRLLKATPEAVREEIYRVNPSAKTLYELIFPPVEWSKALGQKLRDRYYATLNKLGIRITTPLRARYRDKLDEIKHLPSEKEMFNYVEELAYQIQREKAAEEKVEEIERPEPRERREPSWYMGPPRRREEPAWEPYKIEKRKPKPEVPIRKKPSPLTPRERLSPAQRKARAEAKRNEIKMWHRQGLSPEYIAKEMDIDIELVKDVIEED